jgi:hypothetical protein
MSESANLSAASVWTLAGADARLTLGSLQLVLSPANSSTGIRTVTWQARPLANVRLLQLRCPACSPTEPALIDSYIRGQDLVAAYAEAEKGAVQPHVYFRASQAHSAAGLQLIVSMQTSLLDSQPESLVTSELSAHELFVLDSPREHVPEAFALPAPVTDFDGLAGRAAYLFLFRLGGGLSYVEMVHPGDFVSATLESVASAEPGTYQCKLTWRLFPERLEKGVIRRCRVAGWFLPQQNDQEHAAELFRHFVEEPLPLTA